MSVILNGDKYLTADLQIMALKTNEAEGHKIASQICHKIHIQRDLYINDVILDEENSFTKQEDMNETIPYEVLS